MCMPSTPSMPAAPQQTQTMPSDPTVLANLEAQRRRQAMAAGLSATMLTGGAGVGPATTQAKILTGQ